MWLTRGLDETSRSQTACMSFGVWDLNIRMATCNEGSVTRTVTPCVHPFYSSETDDIDLSTCSELLSNKDWMFRFVRLQAFTALMTTLNHCQVSIIKWPAFSKCSEELINPLTKNNLREALWNWLKMLGWNNVFRRHVTAPLEKLVCAVTKRFDGQIQVGFNNVVQFIQSCFPK